MGLKSKLLNDKITFAAKYGKVSIDMNTYPLYFASNSKGTLKNFHRGTVESLRKAGYDVKTNRNSLNTTIYFTED